MRDNIGPDRGVVQPSEFSLVLGGPLYQLFLRPGIVHPPLGRLSRRLITITLFAWLPLLVLSLVQGYTNDTLLQLTLATLLPIAPLVLNMIPFAEIVTKLLGVLL